MRISITGSRKYEHLEDVGRLVAVIAADEPTAVIVSGRAQGVDTYAEDAALALSLGVLSYRPYRISDEEYGIEEWTLGTKVVPSIRKMVEEPTFANYVDALFYRSQLIVDRSDRCVFFWNEWSKGTRFTLGYANDQGKQVTVYTEKGRLA